MSDIEDRFGSLSLVAKGGSSKGIDFLSLPLGKTSLSGSVTTCIFSEKAQLTSSENRTT